MNKSQECERPEIFPLPAQIDEDGMTSLMTLLNYTEGFYFIDSSDFQSEEYKFERRAKLFTTAGIISDFFLDLEFIPNLQNTSDLIINVSQVEFCF